MADLERMFQTGNLLLAQATAGSFFNERDQLFIDSFVGAIDAYRAEHGEPLEQSDVDAEREFAYGSFEDPATNIYARFVITKWFDLSTRIFYSGTDGLNMPFGGF